MDANRRLHKVPTRMSAPIADACLQGCKPSPPKALTGMSTPEAAASHGCEPAAAQSADKDVGTHSRRLVACFCVSCNYSL